MAAGDTAAAAAGRIRCGVAAGMAQVGCGSSSRVAGMAQVVAAVAGVAQVVAAVAGMAQVVAAVAVGPGMPSSHMAAGGWRLA